MEFGDFVIRSDGVAVDETINSKDTASSDMLFGGLQQLIADSEQSRLGKGTESFGRPFCGLVSYQSYQTEQYNIFTSR